MINEIAHDQGFLTRAVFRLSHAGFEVTGQEIAGQLGHVHAHTLLPVLRSTSVGSCANAIAAAIAFLEQSSTARSHPLFARFRSAVVDRLDAIARSRLGAIPMRHGGECWPVIAACLDESVVPFEGTPVEGVQVLGFLETRNLRFDRVFILDVNDDVIPGGDSIDMFLPATLRHLLGLPEQADQDARAEYWFTSLVEGAREVCLFYREGGKKERSRFVERRIWEWQQRDNTITDARYVRNIDYEARVVLPTPAPVRKVPAVIMRLQRLALSASSLDTYLRCQLQFYYRYVLGLEEAVTEKEDVEREEIGKIVHAILMRYYSPYVDRLLDAESLREDNLRRVVRGIFVEEYGREITGPRFLLMNRTEKQLIEFLHRYQKELLKSTDIRVEGVEVALQMQRHGVLFKGRADRVERRGENVHLLDYKTGADAGWHRVRLDRVDIDDRAGWKKEIGSLQLPLYALMYAVVHEIPAERIHPAYLYLGRGELGVEIEESPYKDALLPKERLDVIDEIVGGLIMEMMSPDVPFRGTDDVERDCPSCPFVQMCGTRWAGDQVKTR
jgi:ATP-dependent helicase/nuclease subunit B